MSSAQSFHSMDHRWRRRQHLTPSRRANAYKIISPSAGVTIGARTTTCHDINTTTLRSAASCSRGRPDDCRAPRVDHVFFSSFLNSSNSDMGGTTEVAECAEPRRSESKARRTSAVRLHTPSLMWANNYHEGGDIVGSTLPGSCRAAAGGQSVIKRSLQDIAGAQGENYAWREGLNGVARILALSVAGDGRR